MVVVRRKGRGDDGKIRGGGGSAREHRLGCRFDSNRTQEPPGGGTKTHLCFSGAKSPYSRPNLFLLFTLAFTFFSRLGSRG